MAPKTRIARPIPAVDRTGWRKRPVAAKGFWPLLGRHTRVLNEHRIQDAHIKPSMGTAVRIGDKVCDNSESQHFNWTVWTSDLRVTTIAHHAQPPETILPSPLLCLRTLKEKCP